MRPAPGASLDGRAFGGSEVAARQLGVADHQLLEDDPRIREVHLHRRPGHKINLPPEDYDTWLLGHVIFAPDGRTAIEQQCRDLAATVRVEMEPA